MPSSKAPNPSVSRPRAGKGCLRRYLRKVTGLSRAQMTRLIAQFRERIRGRRGPPAKPLAGAISQPMSAWASG